MQHFNSQPRKEADVAKASIYNVISYFNSQPRKEADDYRGGFYQYMNISIHSLARRLTS